MSEPRPAPEHPLGDVLDEALASSNGDTIRLRDLLDEFGTRSFGPVLIVLALVIISPIGSIPGLPAVLGAAIVLMAVQIVIGRDHPWLPKRLLDTGFDRAKAARFREKARGVLDRIDRQIGPRLEWAAGRIGMIGAAGCLVFLAATMIPLELIPFAVALPGATVLLFGVGLTARDGLVMLIAFALTFSSIALAIYLWPF
ncbi:exopolysaccharide biosynthesis protein [Parasphingopyxis sp.]|uniref:exopolysaccharide biosynthesis protein n=1 Tax=Parasphingopyxis sp. TaxID=1920299 RepID=UPI0026264A28|nr:exopolysaccharide biosynthesis protein [Parasphingopyxis sp.]